MSDYPSLIRLHYDNPTKEHCDVQVFMGDHLLGTLTVPQELLGEFQGGFFRGFPAIITDGDAGRYQRKSLSERHFEEMNRYAEDRADWAASDAIDKARGKHDPS